MKARGPAIPASIPSAAVFLLSLLSGCHSNSDLVEAELRSRDKELHCLRDDATRLRFENEALLQELSAVRQKGGGAITPEQASQSYTLKQIVLARGTGGLDEDNQPGDEALQVVLEPKDGDGHTIKAPGSLQVEVQEVAPTGTKSPLSTWELNQDQLRRTWKNGFWSSGYYITLPWKNWPSWNKLRVTARLTMNDGRVYEADKDCLIKITPAVYRKPSAQATAETPVIAVPAQPLPATAVPVTPLPAPRKVEPAATSRDQPWWITTPPASEAPVKRTSGWKPVERSPADDVHLLRPEHNEDSIE
jgi:hypothetical protein